MKKISCFPINKLHENRIISDIHKQMCTIFSNNLLTKIFLKNLELAAVDSNKSRATAKTVIKLFPKVSIGGYSKVLE